MEFVVGQRNGIVQEHHKAVPCEMFKRSLIRGHEPARCFVIVVDNENQLFRLCGLGKGGESTQIEINDGDVGAVASEEAAAFFAREESSDVGGNESCELGPLTLHCLEKLRVSD